MSNGPPPTRLVFLNDLQSLAPGEKVRFLGWYASSKLGCRPHAETLLKSITRYTAATGTLTLEHAYPPPPHVYSVASVDVNLLLSTLKMTDTQVGEWVNVMGYLEADPTKRGRGKEKREDKEVTLVRVQAIVLWSAGSVRLGDYEDALLRRESGCS